MHTHTYNCFRCSDLLHAGYLVTPRSTTRMGVNYPLYTRSNFSWPKEHTFKLRLHDPPSILVGTTRSTSPDVTTASLRPAVVEGVVSATADPTTWFSTVSKHRIPIDVLYWSNNQTEVSDWSNVQLIKYQKSVPSARLNLSILRIVVFLNVLCSVTAVGPDIQVNMPSLIFLSYFFSLFSFLSLCFFFCLSAFLCTFYVI